MKWVVCPFSLIHFLQVFNKQELYVVALLVCTEYLLLKLMEAGRRMGEYVDGVQSTSSVVLYLWKVCSLIVLPVSSYVCAWC